MKKEIENHYILLSHGDETAAVKFRTFASTINVDIAEAVRDASNIYLYSLNDDATELELAVAAMIMARPQSIVPVLNKDTLQYYCKVDVLDDELRINAQKPFQVQVEPIHESARVLLGLSQDEVLDLIKSLRDPEMTIWSKGGIELAEGWDLTVVKCGLDEEESDNTGSIIYDCINRILFSTPLDIADIGSLYKGLADE